jgi:hypothetical protein
MDIGIPKGILGLKGQRVNDIKLDEDKQQLTIKCSRDRRRNAVDPVTGRAGTINRYVRRQVRDVPLFGYPCLLSLRLSHRQFPEIIHRTSDLVSHIIHSGGVMVDGGSI